MAGATAGCDAGRDREHTSLGCVLAESVEVGCGCGLRGSHIALLTSGKVAKAIQHQEDEVRVGFEGQFRIQSVQVHVAISKVQWFEAVATNRSPVASGPRGI